MTSKQFQQGQEQAIQLYQLYTNTSTPSKANIESWKQYFNQKKKAALDTLDFALFERIKRGTLMMEDYLRSSSNKHIRFGKLISFFISEKLQVRVEYLILLHRYEKACEQLINIAAWNVFWLILWFIGLFTFVFDLQINFNNITKSLQMCLTTQQILTSSLYINHPQQIVTLIGFYNLSPLPELVLMLPVTVIIFLKRVSILFLAVLQFQWFILIAFVLTSLFAFLIVTQLNVFVYRKNKKQLKDLLLILIQPIKEVRRVSKIQLWLRRIINK